MSTDRQSKSTCESDEPCLQNSDNMIYSLYRYIKEFLAPGEEWSSVKSRRNSPLSIYCSLIFFNSVQTKQARTFLAYWISKMFC